MKKLLLVGAIALCGAMNAQAEKGSWVIGGSTTLGFSNAKTTLKYDGKSQDGPTVSTFAFTPSVGYFVANNLAIGLDLGFASITQKEEEGNWTGKTTASTVTALPTATYYFKSGSKILPYLGAGIGYGSTKTSYTETYNGNTDSEDETYSGLAYKAKGGIVFLLNQTVGVDLGVSYTGMNGTLDSDNKIKSTTNTLGANIGFSIFLK